jgi:hypothetical protein
MNQRAEVLGYLKEALWTAVSCGVTTDILSD